jgi:hypothetical protein
MLSAKLRKSCQPNAIIQHVITKNREDEDILRLFVVAKEPIEEFTEITIPLDLEYRGTEIAELDCACRTTDFAAKVYLNLPIFITKTDCLDQEFRTRMSRRRIHPKEGK